MKSFVANFDVQKNSIGLFCKILSRDFGRNQNMGKIWELVSGIMDSFAGSSARVRKSAKSIIEKKNKSEIVIAPNKVSIKLRQDFHTGRYMIMVMVHCAAKPSDIKKLVAKIKELTD